MIKYELPPGQTSIITDARTNTGKNVSLYIHSDALIYTYV